METFLAAQWEIFFGRGKCSFLDFNAFKTSNPATDQGFAENLMKMKKIVPAWGVGACQKFYYVEPPLKPMV